MYIYIVHIYIRSMIWYLQSSKERENVMLLHQWNATKRKITQYDCEHVFKTTNWWAVFWMYCISVNKWVQIRWLWMLFGWTGDHKILLNELHIRFWTRNPQFRFCLSFQNFPFLFSAYQVLLLTTLSLNGLFSFNLHKHSNTFFYRSHNRTYVQNFFYTWTSSNEFVVFYHSNSSIECNTIFTFLCQEPVSFSIIPVLLIYIICFAIEHFPNNST